MQITKRETLSTIKHQSVVDYIGEYTVFQQVLDDALISEIGKQVALSAPRWPKVPEIYCCIIEGTRVNLDILEIGLDFAINHTHGQARSDFLGRLRDVESVGTVFELAMIGALVVEFGEDYVEPYPRLEQKQRSEARLSVEEKELYLEASVLNYSDADNEIFENARQQGGVAVGTLPGTGEGRIVQKIDEKMKRYKIGLPNLLILSQDSCLPLKECAIEAIEEVLRTKGAYPPLCHFAGIFYFDRFNFIIYIENENCEMRLSSTIINSIEKAFDKMRPCN